MFVPGRVALALTCAAVLTAAPAAAQPPQTPPNMGQPRPPVEAPPVASPGQVVRFSDDSAQRTREQLRTILRQYPPSLAEVLRLDPSLLGDQRYLAPYPVLASFLASHPEVSRNPSFFVGEPPSDWDQRPRAGNAARAMADIFQGFTVLAGFLAFFGILGWVLKTTVDYRRWLRLSKVQTDAHVKLLDRFTSNEDLLAYIQTPAGRRFLEAGPIAVDGSRVMGAPHGRILWSLQAGTVVALVGAAFFFVSRRLASDPELAEAAPVLFLIGSIAVAVGLGFLLSAVLAYVVSRRLGILNPPVSPNA